MTAKQKATELTTKFINYVDCEIAGENGFEFCKDTQVDNAKKCALIAVYEMIEQQKEQSDNMFWSCVTYWDEVKFEIEKL